MSEIVICDTNAAIHLAIICPDVLKNPSQKCNIVVHPIVKQEIQNLLLDPDKQKRLGTILQWLAKEVMANTKIGLPPKDKEIKLHQRIKIIEQGLDPKKISSGSSHNDRCFLIIARVNTAKLLTNEKTLFHLGESLLGSDKIWRTSKALDELLQNQIVTKETIQAGLANLKTYEEDLHVECVERLKELGFTF